jgi:hypothetical protein
MRRQRFAPRPKNVLYHDALRGKDVTRAVLFDLALGVM